MKTGRTLVELAQEIERQQNAKKDLVASTQHMRMIAPNFLAEAAGAVPTLQVGDQNFSLNDIAHGQIADHTGVPKKYYDKMRSEAPELLATNVDAWFKKYPAPRMVRTLDGQVRAFLSDRYRPLEHGDLAEAVMPTLLNLKLEIMSCEITERRLYIKAVDPRIQRDVPSGRKMGDGSHVFFDTCSPAIVISNSEVGLGSLSIETGIWTKVCTNLAIAAQRSLKKYHVGGKHEITEGIYQLLSDKTRRATDAAVWMQVRDVVQAAFDEARFAAFIDDVKGLSEQKIDGDPVKVVELASRRFGVTEGESKSVLRHLIEGGDLSRYGLFNAVTRAAQDLDDYDRSTEFERLGGQIIELAANDWRELAVAA